MFNFIRDRKDRRINTKTCELLHIKPSESTASESVINYVRITDPCLIQNDRTDIINGFIIFFQGWSLPIRIWEADSKTLWKCGDFCEHCRRPFSDTEKLRMPMQATNHHWDISLSYCNNSSRSRSHVCYTGVWCWRHRRYGFFYLDSMDQCKPITIKNLQFCVSELPHSQYWYFIWEWTFHSITAEMGFPLRDKITGGYPIIMKFTFVKGPFLNSNQFLLIGTWTKCKFDRYWLALTIDRGSPAILVKDPTISTRLPIKGTSIGKKSIHYQSPKSMKKWCYSWL